MCVYQKMNGRFGHVSFLSQEITPRMIACRFLQFCDTLLVLASLDMSQGGVSVFLKLMSDSGGSVPV